MPVEGAVAIGPKRKRQSFTGVSRMPTKHKKAGPAFAGPARRVVHQRTTAEEKLLAPDYLGRVSGRVTSRHVTHHPKSC